MGGKTGTSSTAVEIPEELKDMVFPFLQDAISRYDQFATRGFDAIMPPAGQTNVNVRSPWDFSSPGSDTDPGGGVGGNGGTPPPGTDPGGGYGGGGNRGGGDNRTGARNIQHR